MINIKLKLLQQPCPIWVSNMSVYLSETESNMTYLNYNSLHLPKIPRVFYNTCNHLREGLNYISQIPRVFYKYKNLLRSMGLVNMFANSFSECTCLMIASFSSTSSRTKWCLMYTCLVSRMLHMVFRDIYGTLTIKMNKEWVCEDTLVINHMSHPYELCETAPGSNLLCLSH